LQDVIDAVNSVDAASDLALAEVLEDSNSVDGANNANGLAVTIAQLNEIIGLTDINNANESAYQIAINEETGFSNPPTVAEVQAIIDAVNAIDSDNDGLPDGEDPNDDNPDTDGDGINDGADADVDGDGTNDNGTDTDGDGINDESDVDVDGDGTNDNGTDTDGDGINDANDTIDDIVDSDGDGVADVDDAFPNDPNESVDNDGDGIGANADFDDDDATIGTLPPAPSIEMANAFTPNGDGINDRWVVPGIENFPNSDVRVYNRSGHQVYQAIGYRNDWEGTYNENRRRLPAGSYYFVISLGDGSAPMSGWVFINY